MAAGALVCVGGMADQYGRAVHIENDVGDGSSTIVEALDLAEAEHLRDPVGCVAGVLVREHRDDALLCHRRPPAGVCKQ